MATRKEQRAEQHQQRAAEQSAERERLAIAQAEAAFNASPKGQARQARADGLAFFQIAIPLEQTMRTALGVLGGDATRSGQKTTTRDPRGVLSDIEAEGFTLEHVGYVFRETGMVTRDKMLSSGQTGSVSGDIVGIYLFRAVQP